jgi:hypothetical protein
MQENEETLPMDEKIVEIARLYARKVKNLMPVSTVNKRIEPVLMCREHDKSGFLKNVLRHGKIIYKSRRGST